MKVKVQNDDSNLEATGIWDRQQGNPEGWRRLVETNVWPYKNG